MNMRRITSLTGLVSFIIIVLTSVILYIAPHGRVAYWADWHFWGLTKTQWGDIHINVGILFLLALFLHIYYNWKPITAYLKNKAREMKFFTGEMNVALALTALFTVGTLLHVPPFSSVLDFAESIKEAAGRKYGEPPWGHAELSPIGTFATKMGWDADKAVAILEAAGYEVASPKETVAEIAADKGVPPQELYLTLKAELDTAQAPQGALPETPPAGFGQRSLQQIAETYGVALHPMLEALKAKGIEADAETSLKNIAANAGANPYDLFEIIKTATKQAPAAPAAGSQGVGQGAGQGGGQGRNQGQAAADGQQPMGLGRMTLGEVVQEHGFDRGKAEQALEALGVQPDMDAKMRPLAEAAGLTPMDLYDAMKQAQ